MPWLLLPGHDVREWPRELWIAAHGTEETALGRIGLPPGRGLADPPVVDPEPSADRARVAVESRAEIAAAQQRACRHVPQPLRALEGPAATDAPDRIAR